MINAAQIGYSTSSINKVNLSPRQHAVIQLRANGFLNKQIARELGIQECTVKEHVSIALRKMRCKTVNQAILVLAQTGELTLSKLN